MDTVVDIPKVAEALARCTHATQAERELIGDLALIHALAVRGVRSGPNLDAGVLAHHKSEHTLRELIRLRTSAIHPDSLDDRTRLADAELYIWAKQLARALFKATNHLVDHLDEHAYAAFFMGVVNLEPDILRDDFEAYHRRIAEILSTETIIVMIDRADEGITPIAA